MRKSGILLSIASAALAGCLSTESQFNIPGAESSVDFIPDASICACSQIGDPCGIYQQCCGNLACQGGSCVPTAQPVCAGFGEVCNATLPCCVPPAPDGGWGQAVPPTPGCLLIDGGEGICFIGANVGDACGPGAWGCASELQCVGRTCQYPSSGATCPHSDGGCSVGDDCTAALTTSINTMAFDDPCNVSGLDCLYTGSTFLCLQPEVLPPPFLPQLELENDYSVCDPVQSTCLPWPGGSAPTGCGTVYFEALNAQMKIIAAPAPVCVELCAKPDDCTSLAVDCVGSDGGAASGQCVLNYCYAAPDQTGLNVAGLLTTAMGTPVSSDAGVLFQPCAHGGPNTICLPQNDNSWNTTTGICYRVGGPDAGGIGASCDLNAPRSDPSAMCREGTLCFKGTCYGMCDTGGTLPCAGGQTCIGVQGQLVSSTANAHGAGVCVDNCDLYQDENHNSCPQAPCGTPQALCKPAGVDSDVFPIPGICVGGVATPIKVGQACDPYQRVDPCASGAICTATLSGSGFVCAQACDPAPSPSRANTTPSCPVPTSCHGVGRPVCDNPVTGGPCKHVGVCL